MRRLATRRPTTGALLAAAILLAGCGGDEPAPAPPSSTSSPSPEASETPDATPTGPEGVGVGEVVDGFPVDVIPVLPDATVILSTAVPADGVTSVTLAGTSEQPAADILAFYQAALVEQGFAVTASAPASGVVGATFSRAEATEIITVSVTTVDGVQTFTVGGQLAG